MGSNPINLDQAIAEAFDRLFQSDRDLAASERTLRSLRAYEQLIDRELARRRLYGPPPPLLRRQPPAHPSQGLMIRIDETDHHEEEEEEEEEKTQDLILDPPSDESACGLVPDPSTSDLS